jgi:chromosomal replication initiation ATPase DnaA
LINKKLQKIKKMFDINHTSVIYGIRRITDIIEGTQTGKRQCRMNTADETITADVVALKEMLTK